MREGELGSKALPLTNRQAKLLQLMPGLPEESGAKPWMPSSHPSCRRKLVDPACLSASGWASSTGL